MRCCVARCARWKAAGSRLKKSSVRRPVLHRLGFFEEVNVETPAVAGTTDQVDVNYSVTERPSGNLVSGPGLCAASGLLFNTSVTQDNFLGTRQSCQPGVQQQPGQHRIQLRVSQSLLHPGWCQSWLWQCIYRTTDADEANLADYTMDTFGGDVNFGIPINEFDTVNMSVSDTRIWILVQHRSPACRSSGS